MRTTRRGFALATAGLLTPFTIARASASAATFTAKQVAFQGAMRALWEEHITWTRLFIVDFIAAAPEQEATKARLLRNQTDLGADGVLAAFLHTANPVHWPLAEMRTMMRDHLDNTLAEAVAHLTGEWADDIAAYDRVHRQILAMADMLNAGIVGQFPGAFA